MAGISLDVVQRENTGTGNARAVRREGMVPAVLYGGDKSSVAIAVKQNEVIKAINSGQFLANMIEIKHDGKPQKVLTKDVQYHPVTDMPMHVDFFRVTAKSIIEVEVSVNILGEDEAPGLKEGGTLNIVRYSIEVKCPAGSIPDSIDVDVSAMQIGDAIHISDITLPEGVTPSIDDRDFTIATVVQSRAAVEEEDDAEAVDAGDVPTTDDAGDADGEESEG